MLDPVISNSISLTSWKCEASVTLKLDKSLQGKGWARVSKRRSKFVFGTPSSSFRKWNVYVGGSLPQEPSRKQSKERFNTMFKQTINQCITQNSRFIFTQWNDICQRWVQSINFVPQRCEPWVNYSIRSGENRFWGHIWIIPWRNSLIILLKKKHK